MVRFSASPMYDAQMQHTEWGIDPDIKVDLNAADKENGYDTIIEKAIEILNRGIKNEKIKNNRNEPADAGRI